MDLPLDGAISKYAAEEAPHEVRAILAGADADSVTNPQYPYPEEMKRKAFKAEMADLQVELVRFQCWVKESGARVAILFEGQDASGKGGAINAFTKNLNPRGARVVALPKPSDAEAGQWYFQRYVCHLPAKGEIVLFDRSWYNRGVVEKVFGFCTDAERVRWFKQVVPFEKLVVNEGILLFKVWLHVGRATQLERFLDRERDPLKQWKLSWIDAEGLRKWDDYARAIDETLAATHHADAPWVVIRADDKRRARLNLIRSVLRPIDYARRDKKALGKIDPLVVGGPEVTGLNG